MSLNGTETLFKLDTGAEVTAISEAFKHLCIDRKLFQKPIKVLYDPACQSLKVVGQFKGELQTRKHSYQETVFVVRGLKNDLLGLPALTAFQLVQKLKAYCSAHHMTKNSQKSSLGLETLVIPTVKDDATPRALLTPKNVLIPLRDKVKSLRRWSH